MPRYTRPARERDEHCAERRRCHAVDLNKFLCRFSFAELFAGLTMRFPVQRNAADADDIARSASEHRRRQAESDHVDVVAREAITIALKQIRVGILRERLRRSD
jgi:hypothetical protein